MDQHFRQVIMSHETPRPPSVHHPSTIHLRDQPMLPASLYPSARKKASGSGLVLVALAALRMRAGVHPNRKPIPVAMCATKQSSKRMVIRIPYMLMNKSPCNMSSDHAPRHLGFDQIWVFGVCLSMRMRSRKGRPSQLGSVLFARPNARYSDERTVFGALVRS